MEKSLEASAATVYTIGPLLLTVPLLVLVWSVPFELMFPFSTQTSRQRDPWRDVAWHDTIVLLDLSHVFPFASGIDAFKESTALLAC